ESERRDAYPQWQSRAEITAERQRQSAFVRRLHSPADPKLSEVLVSGFTSSLSTMLRLALPYFRSEDRWAGRVLLIAVIAMQLSLVGIAVLLNAWYNRFYNALQERDWDAFVTQLLYFCVLAGTAVVLEAYQLYLNQWLQIRWRRWMT